MIDWVQVDSWGHVLFGDLKHSRFAAVRWLRHRLQGQLCYRADKQIGVFDD